MNSAPDKAKSWQMFDRIASTYDPLNRILSMGIDKLWRRRLAQEVPKDLAIDLLDLATGTGDQLFALCSARPKLRRAVGMDLSQGMLEIAKQKRRGLSLSQDIEIQRGDATAIPADDESFDLCTISFGIRNVEHVDVALSEMYRVLRPGGSALILEFGLPKNALFRAVYLAYFRVILPFIGGLISGDKEAYRYLNQTVESFPYDDAFCELMREAGFEGVHSIPLSLGIAYLYVGAKV